MATRREQVESMRKGMATIIPIQLLSLFTWQELELNVCGKNKIDIQLLRENTRFQYGFSDEDEHVQMLWRTLESFTVRHSNVPHNCCFCWLTC